MDSHKNTSKKIISSYLVRLHFFQQARKCRQQTSESFVSLTQVYFVSVIVFVSSYAHTFFLKNKDHSSSFSSINARLFIHILPADIFHEEHCSSSKSLRLSELFIIIHKSFNRIYVFK